MKTKLASSILLVAALMTGCVTGYKGSEFSLEDAAKIQAGMTKEQVVQLLGQPTHKSSRVGDEVWVWSNYNMATRESRTATVIFVNGQVQASPLSGKPVQ